MEYVKNCVVSAVVQMALKLRTFPRSGICYVCISEDGKMRRKLELGIPYRCKLTLHLPACRNF